MLIMRKLLLVFVLSIPMFGQVASVFSQQPDCWMTFNLRANGATPAFDNTTKGCTLWAVQYAASGYGSLSLVTQTAPAIGGGAGSVLPGSWSTFTAATGINPNTSIVGAISTFGSPTAIFAFLRVNLTASAGTGTLQGSLFGWRIPAQTGGGGSGCVGTVGTPCIVAGPDATGSSPTQSPVAVSGLQGGLIQPFVMDNSSSLQVTCLPNDPCFTLPLVTVDGGGTIGQFVGNAYQAFSLSAATTTTVVTHSSGSTHLTNLSLTLTTALTGTQNMLIVEGTGSNCGTSTVTMMGPFYAFQFFSPPLSNSTLQTAAAGDDICLVFSTTVTGGGGALFARF